MSSYVEEIKCFFDKYNICDKILKSFDYLMIKQVYKIINGIIKDKYYDGVSFNNDALYYELKKKDYYNAEKYYLMAIEHGNVNAMNDLADLYEKQQRNDEAEKYYLMAIEHGNVNAMNDLAGLYDKQQRNDEAEKYYLMAFEHEAKYAAYNLAVMYYALNRISDAKKYYLIAIENNDNDAMYYLAKIYHKQNRFDDAKIYYLMAVEYGNKQSFNELKDLVNNDIELYKLINKIENKNDHIYDILKELKQIKAVRNYENKMNMSYKIGECPICYDSDVKLISLECAHQYCCNCYIHVLNKCAYNCDN